MDSKTEKVGKLLTLAERASTAEEAQAFYAKAQELASRHSLDLAVARQAVSKKEQREVPVARTINIGEKGKYANKPLVSLIDTIARVNDVDIVIYNASTRIIATGFPSDLDVVEALWLSASTTMVKHGDELIRDKNAAWRSETVEVEVGGYWDYDVVTKPVGAKGARRSFYDSFISGFGSELRKIRKEAIKESDERHFHENALALEAGAAPVASGTELVLKEKIAEVEAARQDWYKAKHGTKRMGSWSGSSNARHSSSMSAQGYVAGRKAAADVSAAPARSAIAS
jgi:Protein of unknown function (DUF2786)